MLIAELSIAYNPHFVVMNIFSIFGTSKSYRMKINIYQIFSMILLLSTSLFCHAVLPHRLPASNFDIVPVPQFEQLPQKAIHRIFQDTEGYMWYGTFNGLCRTDGYNIKTYRSDFLNQQIMESNYITDITEDIDGKIWYGTLRGCHILNKATNEVTKVKVPAGLINQNVFTVTSIDDGSIWVSYQEGQLVRYGSSGEIQKIYRLGEGRCAYTVMRNYDGRILISITGKGMWLVDWATDKLEPYFQDERYLDIERVIYDRRNNCYWLGTWGHGVVRFNPSATDSNKIYVEQNRDGGDNGNEFYTYHMVQDDLYNYLWVTTKDDLYAYEVDADLMLHRIDLSEILPKGNKLLYEIYKDREGCLWISDFGGSSFVIDTRQPTTNRYTFPAIASSFGCGVAINAFALLGSKALVIQERQIPVIYNLHDHKFMPLVNSGYWLGDINRMYKPLSAPNCIWAWNTWTAVLCCLKIDAKEDVSVEFTIDLGQCGFPVERINVVLADSNGAIWLGTNQGLYKIDSPTTGGKPCPIVDIGCFTAITSTSDGDIWGALDDGHLIHIENNVVLEQIPMGMQISHLASTSDGDLWGATESGMLVQLRVNDGICSIVDHSAKCNLNGDGINNLLIDNYNHIWLSSSNEILEYNPRTNAYRLHSTNSPGFILNRIIDGCVAFDEMGYVYFGGMGGIVGFKPSQELESMPEKVSVYISDLKVNDKSIINNSSVGDRSVSLPSDAVNIAIEMTSLDILNADKVRYAYKLDGVDDDWVYLPAGKNRAFYNRISSGNHVFHAKAIGKNGLWSSSEKVINVWRKPEWHETWWAKAVAFVLIISLSVFVIRYLMNRAVRLDQQKFLDSKELLRIREYIESNKKSGNKDFVEFDIYILDSIKKIVEENLSQPDFDVKVLSEKMNMSRSTLARKIKAITGMTPLDYIKNIKLDHAASMLGNKSVAVSDVIEALGYSDYKNFSRIFKARFGMTPSQWSRKERNNVIGTD